MNEPWWHRALWTVTVLLAIIGLFTVVWILFGGDITAP